MRIIKVLLKTCSVQKEWKKTALHKESRVRSNFVELFSLSFVEFISWSSSRSSSLSLFSLTIHSFIHSSIHRFSFLLCLSRDYPYACWSRPLSSMVNASIDFRCIRNIFFSILFAYEPKQQFNVSIINVIDLPSLLSSPLGPCSIRFE